MRFYRGIAVPALQADTVVSSIREGGMRFEEGRRPMRLPDLKPRLGELWALPRISEHDTRSGAEFTHWICACAEQDGALYYACHHNRSGERDASILVEIEAEERDVAVDSSDFLMTIFQFGDPVTARPVVEQAFGPAILKYLDRAWLTKGKERIAICQLAVQDREVIQRHAQNTVVISGRWGTRFRSAFLVRAPIEAKRIVDVRRIDACCDLPEAVIDLNLVVLPPDKRQG